MPRSLSHTEDEDEDTAGTVTTAVCRESTQGLRLAVLYDAAAAGDLARLEAAIETTPGDLEFAPPDERQRNPPRCSLRRAVDMLPSWRDCRLVTSLRSD